MRVADAVGAGTAPTWLRWAVLSLVAAYVPLSILKLERFSASGAEIQFALKAMHVLVAMAAMGTCAIVSRSLVVFRPPAPYLCLIVVGAFSLVWTVSVSEGLKALTELLAVYVLYTTSRQIRLSSEHLLWSIALGCIAVVLASLVVYYKIPSAVVDYTDERYRLAGITYGSHALARAALIGVAALMLMSDRFAGRSQIVGFIFLPAAVFCILETYSRQSLLILAILMLVWLGRHVGSRVAIVVTIVGSMVALLAAPKDIVDQVIVGLSRNDVSDVLTLSGRVYVWDFAWAEIFERPFLGLGFGAADTYLLENYSNASGWTTTSAHNAILHGAMELGVVGALIYVWIYSQALRQGVVGARREGFAFFLALFLVTIAVLEQGLAGGADYLMLCWVLFLGGGRGK